MLPNFYASDGDDSDENLIASGGTSKEMEKVDVQLREELYKCDLCNLTKEGDSCKPCLINKARIHRKLNHEQIRAWVCALVRV